MIFYCSIPFLFFWVSGYVFIYQIVVFLFGFVCFSLFGFVYLLIDLQSFIFDVILKIVRDSYDTLFRY